MRQLVEQVARVQTFIGGHAMPTSVELAGRAGLARQTSAGVRPADVKAFTFMPRDSRRRFPGLRMLLSSATTRSSVRLRNREGISPPRFARALVARVRPRSGFENPWDIQRRRNGLRLSCDRFCDRPCAVSGGTAVAARSYRNPSKNRLGAWAGRSLLDRSVPVLRPVTTRLFRLPDVLHVPCSYTRTCLTLEGSWSFPTDSQLRSSQVRQHTSTPATANARLCECAQRSTLVSSSDLAADVTPADAVLPRLATPATSHQRLLP
jgi:hypothetical protein